MSKPKAKEPMSAASAKITAKVPGYSGESAGVQFRDGVGETNDPWKIRWFKEHGYDVESALAPTVKEKEPAEKITDEEKGDE